MFRSTLTLPVILAKFSGLEVDLPYLLYFSKRHRFWSRLTLTVILVKFSCLEVDLSYQLYFSNPHRFRSIDLPYLLLRLSSSGSLENTGQQGTSNGSVVGCLYLPVMLVKSSGLEVHLPYLLYFSYPRGFWSRLTCYTFQIFTGFEVDLSLIDFISDNNANTCVWVLRTIYNIHNDNL